MRILRDLAILTGAGLIGNWVAEKFILKSTPDDKNGFVLIAPGFGWDDVARAGAFAGAAILLHLIVPGRHS